MSRDAYMDFISQFRLKHIRDQVWVNDSCFAAFKIFGINFTRCRIECKINSGIAGIAGLFEISHFIFLRIEIKNIMHILAWCWVKDSIVLKRKIFGKVIGLIQSKNSIGWNLKPLSGLPINGTGLPWTVGEPVGGKISRLCGRKIIRKEYIGAGNKIGVSWFDDVWRWSICDLSIIHRYIYIARVADHRRIGWRILFVGFYFTKNFSRCAEYRVHTLTFCIVNAAVRLINDRIAKGLFHINDLRIRD